MKTGLAPQHIAELRLWNANRRRPTPSPKVVGLLTFSTPLVASESPHFTPTLSILAGSYLPLELLSGLKLLSLARSSCSGSWSSQSK